MSDYFCPSQELNKYFINIENEYDIFQIQLDNLSLSEFKKIFDSNKNNLDFENDEPKDEELYFIDKKTNKNTNNSSTLNKSIFNISKVYKKENNQNIEFTKKKRGRQIKVDTSKIVKKIQKPHDKFANDNLLRKIQVHYISFIISAININLKALDYKEQFLNYEIKKNINKNFFKLLKDKSLSEIICNKISKRYKNYDSNINNKIFIKLKIKTF